MAYRNRGESLAVGGTGLAGRYTVSVFLEEDPEDGSYIVPFTMSLGVTGEARSGPEYVEPTEPSESAGAEPTEDSSTSSAEQTGGDPQSGSDVGTTADSGADGPGVGLVIGVAGLAVLAVAGYLVFRKKSAGGGGV